MTDRLPGQNVPGSSGAAPRERADRTTETFGLKPRNGRGGAPPDIGGARQFVADKPPRWVPLQSAVYVPLSISGRNDPPHRISDVAHLLTQIGDEILYLVFEVLPIRKDWELRREYGAPAAFRPAMP